MKKVLLTGGTGFVGSVLARRLIADGHQVHLLLRPSFRAWRIREIQRDLRCHTITLTNPSEVQTLVRRVKPDWVFHLAAYGAYSYQKDVQAMLRSNILGLLHLLSACANVGCDAFVSAGSSSEYGYKDHAPRENEVLEPNSDYAVTKAAAGWFCQLAAEKQGVPTITLRLYSVFGPYEEPTRLIPTLLVRGLEGRWPPLVHPSIARDFIYVDDAVDAFIRAARRAAKHKGTVYNIGTGRQTTLRQVIQAVQRHLPIREKPRWSAMKNRIWDTQTWVAAPQKARRELAWSSSTSFEKGLLLTQKWLLNHPTHLAFYRRMIHPGVS